MVVHGNRQNAFRLILPDDIFIQLLFEFGRFFEGDDGVCRILLFKRFVQHGFADFHAVFADERSFGRSDQLSDFAFFLAAKGTVSFFFSHGFIPPCVFSSVPSVPRVPPVRRNTGRGGIRKVYRAARPNKTGAPLSYFRESSASCLFRVFGTIVIFCRTPYRLSRIRAPRPRTYNCRGRYPVRSPKGLSPYFRKESG